MFPQHLRQISLLICELLLYDQRMQNVQFFFLALLKVFSGITYYPSPYFMYICKKNPNQSIKFNIKSNLLIIAFWNPILLCLLKLSNYRHVKVSYYDCGFYPFFLLFLTALALCILTCYLTQRFIINNFIVSLLTRHFSLIHSRNLYWMLIMCQALF